MNAIVNAPAAATLTKEEALVKKLNNARALVSKYENEIAQLSSHRDLANGGSASFAYGRGDKKVQYTGVVQGTAVGGNGVAMVAVLVGSGIDAQILRVPVSSVTAYAAPGEALAVPADTQAAGAVAEEVQPEPQESAETDVDSLLAGI